LTAVALVGAAPSADHQRLVYANDGKIVLYDAATARSTVVSRTGRVQVEGGAEPHWSPGGRRLSLIGRGGELLSMKADGTDVRRLADGDNHAEAWSSDGRWVAFQAFHREDSRGDLRIVRSDGTRLHRISTVSSLHPMWIPGTHRMVVERGDSKPETGRFVHDIVVVGAGAKLAVVPHSADCDFSCDPAVSRSGRWIAFAKAGRIVVERLNGSGFKAVTAPGRKHYDTEPAWSPDGKRISFTRVRYADIAGGDASAIMVAHLKDGGARTVARNGLNNASDWSRNGRYLSFAHGTDVGGEIVVVDLRAGRAHTVGFFDGSDSRPDWVG
jgi:Tol biopolymer transport system component